MAILKTFDNDFEAFLSYNRERFYDNYFVYFHLLDLVQKMREKHDSIKEMRIYDFFIIENGEASFIISVWLSGNFFVYGDKWDEDCLKLFLQRIDLSKFKNFYFMGRRELTIELLNRQNVHFTIIKDRLVYECSEVTKLQSIVGKVENAKIDDLNELISMNRNFYIEEYPGKSKSVREYKSVVVSGISESTLYVIKDSDNNLCGSLQIVGDRQELPIIGSLYTKTDVRNRGYSSSLLFIVTKGMLDAGHEKCGLFSDIRNPASNKVFSKVGYKAIYPWVFLEKK